MNQRFIKVSAPPSGLTGTLSTSDHNQKRIRPAAVVEDPQLEQWVNSSQWLICTLNSGKTVEGQLIGKDRYSLLLTGAQGEVRLVYKHAVAWLESSAEGVAQL